MRKSDRHRRWLGGGARFGGKCKALAKRGGSENAGHAFMVVECFGG